MSVVVQQKVFNKVYNHLLTQKSQSYLSDGITCAYRGTDGKQCAVGCLIPDSKYRIKYEEKSVGEEDIDKLLMEILNVGTYHYKEIQTLLKDLQLVHDNIPPTRWKSSLKVVADMHSLNVPT